MINQGTGVGQVGDIGWAHSIINNMGPTELSLKLSKIIGCVNYFGLKEHPRMMG